MKHLVIGGTRNGKSAFAEKWLEATGKTCIYVATGWAGDEEMAQRIAHHKKQRASHWYVVEEPLQLAKVLELYNHKDYAVLIDCLTLWLSNALHGQHGDDAATQKNVWAHQREAFLQCLEHLQCTLALVSNEVGSGIVPLGALTRSFADEAGRLNQRLAERCNVVTLLVAGIPMELKREPSE